MGDLDIAQNDTWPPVRGSASDQDGLLDLTTADWLKFIMKSGATVVSGTADPLDPPESNPDGADFNWQYTWAASDTAVIGEYETELEVHWDDSATPPQIQTIPGSEGAMPVIEVRDDLA